MDFKKKERQKEVDALIAETVILQEKKENLISQNEDLTEEKEQTILDTKALKAESLRKMLVNLVKSLTIKCVNLVQDRKIMKGKYDRVSVEVTTLRKKNGDLKDKQELLKGKEADLERVKQYMGMIRFKI